MREACIGVKENPTIEGILHARLPHQSVSFFRSDFSVMDRRRYGRELDSVDIFLRGKNSALCASFDSRTKVRAENVMVTLLSWEFDLSDSAWR